MSDSPERQLLLELVANYLQYLDWNYSPENGVDDYLERVCKTLGVQPQDLVTRTIGGERRG